MKKTVSLLLSILMTLSLAVPVCADFLMPTTPSNTSTAGNSFFNKHRGECVYRPRDYYVLGADGKASAYNAPDGTVKNSIANDEIVHANYRYENWVLITAPSKVHYLWISLDDLVTIYDREDFLEGHSPVDPPSEEDWGELTGSNITFWSFPGSSDYHTSPTKYFRSLYYRTTSGEFYADAYGEVYLRMKDDGTFVRISDPCSTDPSPAPHQTEPAETPSAAAEETAASTESVPSVSEETHPVPTAAAVSRESSPTIPTEALSPEEALPGSVVDYVMAALMVMLAVAISALLLILFRKKK